MNNESKKPKDTQKDPNEALEQGMFPTPAASELMLAPSDYQHIFHEPSKLHTPEHAAGTSTGGQHQVAGIPTIPQVRQQTQQEQQQQQIAQQEPTVIPQVRAEATSPKSVPQVAPKENVFQGITIPGLPPNMVPMLMTDAQGVQRVVLVPMAGLTLQGSLPGGVSVQSVVSKPTPAVALAPQPVPQPETASAPRPEQQVTIPTIGLAKAQPPMFPGSKPSEIAAAPSDFVHIFHEPSKAPAAEEGKANTPVVTPERAAESSSAKAPPLIVGGQQAVITSNPTVTTELPPSPLKPAEAPLPEAESTVRSILSPESMPAEPAPKVTASPPPAIPTVKRVKSVKSKTLGAKTAKPKAVGKKEPAAAATPLKRMSSPECVKFLQDTSMGRRKFEDPWEKGPYPDYKPKTDRR